jgi:AcrR family transcriptional regulator
MPRLGLNRERVVAAAADLADEVGWDRLSLAAVAERLGVRLPSLYKHIESLGGLRRDVAALATAELAQALTRPAVGVSGAAALRAVGTAYRDYAAAHPGRYAAALRAPRGGSGPHEEASEAILRVIFAILEGYGLTGETAVDATRALRSTLHGFAALEAAGGFGMPRDVDRSYTSLIDGLDAMMRRWGGAHPVG